MLDHHYLSNILKELKTHNVKYFKMNGLELEFHVEQSPVIASLGRFSENTKDPNKLGTEDSTKILADTIKKQEEAMPPDLRADALMDHDKVLNWSSPDQELEQPELPLTGEQPL